VNRTFAFQALALDDVGKAMRRHDDRQIVCQSITDRTNTPAASGFRRHRQRT
jgi:hypothetical protein